MLSSSLLFLLLGELLLLMYIPWNFNPTFLNLFVNRFGLLLFPKRELFKPHWGPDLSRNNVLAHPTRVAQAVRWRAPIVH